MHSEVIVVNEEGRPSSEYPSVTPVQERKTSPYLTKYEVARIVGERARQIVNGTSVLLQGTCGTTEREALELAERCSDPHSFVVDPVHIAKVDLLQGRIPMILCRMWPGGRTEYIPVSELLVDKSMLNIQN